MDQNFTRVAGTSASAPIFASLIAAVNDARIAAGKTPVGWINPAVRLFVCIYHSRLGISSLFDRPQLYSHSFADSFHDVTNGTNPGCGREGFRASPGWDPVSGLGTPNFERLRDNFLRLP